MSDRPVRLRESRLMIVRWGLESLPAVLQALSIQRPLLISTPRWEDADLPVSERFFGVLAHAEVTGVQAATEQAKAEAVDGLVAMGGGSAIDTSKAVSTALDLPIVSIPTTYSGAEWTRFYGIRNAATGVKSAGNGARVEAIVYDPDLTMTLPAFETCGTAMNALAHCAEALYAADRTEETDRDAVAGARLVSAWLPKVMADAADPDARKGLLEGAMHGGAALRAGMGLGHAMAQALGGGFGLPHGPLNAVCLPHALRFNSDVARTAIAKLGHAMDCQDPIARAETLGALGCPMRLRDYDIDQDALEATAEKIATRPAAMANPRPASVAQILELLHQAW